ncbi:MAG: pitrilysin family protein [Enhygromyxa sp.]
MKRQVKRQVASILGLCLALAPACKREESTVPDQVQTPTVEPDVAEVEWPDEPFRAERPTPKPIQDVKIPGIETFTLDNGLEVFLVQQATLPTVSMYFEWDYGQIDDPRGLTGVTSLCSDLLDEATRDKDKASFAAAQDDHAVSVWASGGVENTHLGVRALRRELGPALDLAAEMLLTPGLRQEDFDRLVQQEKNWIEQSKGSASSIAYRLFPSLVWGSSHRYGKLETAATVDKIKLADCKKWAAKLQPGGARLWVVGKISEAELRAELDARFGGWKGKAPKPPKITPAKPAKGTIYFVHVEGAAQSQILIGHPGPARTAEDYETTALMAQIFGGSFSSRINMNLREDKGWSYGARAGFDYRRGGSSFSVGSSVVVEQTGPALLEVAKEIERMRTTDPSADELRREQEFALLAMPAEFATATRTLNSFRSLEFYGLPLDWHAGHQERLRAADLVAIRAAAETHLQDRDQVVLVVGDGKVVLEALDKIAADEVFGAGGLQFLDADGNPVARPTFEGSSK